MVDADTGSLCPGTGWRGEGDGWDHGEEEEEDKHELWDPHTNTQAQRPRRARKDTL